MNQRSKQVASVKKPSFKVPSDLRQKKLMLSSVGPDSLETASYEPDSVPARQPIVAQ